jgi:hypothetical protein
MSFSAILLPHYDEFTCTELGGDSRNGVFGVNPQRFFHFFCNRVFVDSALLTVTRLNLIGEILCPFA